MTSDSSDTSSLFPLTCAVCHTEAPMDDGGLLVVSPDEELPDDEDEWYLHLHDAANMETRQSEGVIRDGEWYAFCPDCRPSKALPTAVDDPEFDIDIFLHGLREDRQDDGTVDSVF